MWYDRPTVEFFIVKGLPTGVAVTYYKGSVQGLKIYGETETKEGAEMLAEEAKRVGWSAVHVFSRRKSTY